VVRATPTSSSVRRYIRNPYMVIPGSQLWGLAAMSSDRESLQPDQSGLHQDVPIKPTRRMGRFRSLPRRVQLLVVAAVVGLLVAVDVAGTSKDTTPIFIIALVVLDLWICYRIGRAAERKGRSYLAWFWISFFTSPLLAGIIIATIAPQQMEALPSKEQIPDPTISGGSDLVPCPRCAEPIRSAAVICRFCNFELASPT
jgi:hypothetical protein